MPTANIWKGHLTFGLVSLPVKRSRAARGQTTHFHLLHAPDHSRIRQAIYCLAEGRPVPRDQLIKGYEYQKDRYVVMRDEELRQVAPQTAKVMELLEFVSMDEVDPVYLESSYYLAPDRGGERPYALLYEALRQEHYYGLAQVAMHHREHIVILRPGTRGLLLHTMYYTDEVRQEDEFPADSRLVQDKELELARLLIRAGVAQFQPEKYHDTYRANLQKLIEAKITGQQFQSVPGAPRAPAMDILEALKRSLDARKEPIQTPRTQPARVEAVNGPIPAGSGQPGPGPSRRRHPAGPRVPEKTAPRGRSRLAAKSLGGHEK